MRELRKLSDLINYGFMATDGEIGHFKQIYFDDLHWQVRYLVLQTGNWLMGRQVLLVPAAINKIDDNNKRIHVDISCEQIEKSPPVDSQQPVSQHYQQQYYSYYGWEPYWTTDPLFLEIPPVPPLITPEQAQKPDNPHLRSSEEVTGYKLETMDGPVGHIEDLIVDNQTWAVRYLEIDTRNLLPGRHVLMSPAWVEQVDWAKRHFEIELPKELVKNAPEYGPEQIISRDYELALYRHYGKALTE